MLKNLSID